MPRVEEKSFLAMIRISAVSFVVKAAKHEAATIYREVCMWRKNRRTWWWSLAVLTALLLAVVPAVFAGEQAPETRVAQGPVSQGALQVKYPVRMDTSAPLREMKPVSLDAREAEKAQQARETLRLVRMLSLPKAVDNAGKSGPTDPSVVQSTIGLDGMVSPSIPSATASFDGIDNSFGVLPPDTNGDIGYDPATGTKYYMQSVNLGFAIWDVTDPANPNLLLGPVANNTMWSGFGGICETNNDGDPIVLYDHLANRWLFSQFALNFPNDFHQCIAVSATADPTGAWYRYDFQVSTTKMNDYPHFGVWRDAYYMTANQFDGSSFAWAGAGVWAFERDAMLQGLTARVVYFDVGSVTLDYGGMLPADLDGVAPPAGTPGFFVEWDDSTWLGDPADTLRIWEFHVDWNNPANSTFGADPNFTPNYTVQTADVDPNMCNFNRNCIPQPGGTAVDAISDRLMHRLVFRMWGANNWSLLGNHTVDATGTDVAGIHWFELNWDGTTWAMAQEGVYAPADGNHRWMASIAADKDHNIALGYSISSTSTFPSVYYTGRLASDPAGQMSQGEGSFVNGGGSQGHSSGRWGDYSMMGVDPADDCTFWYTQEYYKTDSTATWSTRIGAFTFPSCTAAATGALTGTIIDANTSSPIEGARVEIVELGYVTYTDASGVYTFTSVPVGTYTVTASAFGYNDATATNVAVNDGATTTQDFSLTPLPKVNVTFTVSDGNTGWPLYARIDVDGVPGAPFFTDPVTGTVTVSLPTGTYTAHVSAMSGGYDVFTDTQIINADTNWVFGLNASASCTAPGYDFVGFTEDFEGGVPPTGWQVVDNVAGGGLVWMSNVDYGDANYTGGAGLAADVNSDANQGVPYDTELWTPVIDPATLPSLTLMYKANYQDLGGANDLFDLDVSTDGGTTWTNVLRWNEDHGALYGLPGEDVVVDLAPYVGTSPFILRWHYYTSDAAPWDWYAQIDEVKIGACAPVADGLVVGAVYDANTNALLPDFSVTDGTYTAVVADTSADPATPDKMYFLGSMAGTQTLTASTSKAGYGTDSASVTVTAGTTVGQDFYLPAAQLAASPSSLSFSLLQLAEKKTQSFTLQNTGGLDAGYNIIAVKGALAPLNPVGFAAPRRLMGWDALNATTANGWRGEIDRSVSALAAGDVTGSWAPGLGYAWGIGFDKAASSGQVWIGDLAVVGGTDRDYQYETDGTPTGNSMDFSSWVGFFAADMAYDPFRGTFWQVNVGGDNCVYEMDPVAMAPTGEKICPAWPVSQRGLAYDPVSDTFFAGGWNDSTIYRFRRDGSLVESVFVNLPISGLAYNPSTGHLFALINADTSDPAVYDVYVLDVNNAYAMVGGFDVVDGGTPVFGANAGQAGMGIDCNGTLWIVDQGDQLVYQVDSGETGVCDWQADWITVDVASGTVAAGGSVTIQVTVDAYSLSYGTHEAYLRIINDSPYGPVIVPVQTDVQGYVQQFGDFNGDGKDDIAIFRPSTGDWWIRGQGRVHYGQTGDIPVPADYNGDGKAEVAIFRPSTGDWWIRGQGRVHYGQTGDIPVPADYNGDGKAEVAIFRPSTGDWWIRGQGRVHYGQTGDIPVPADYNGDGKDDIAIFRPSTGVWWIRGQGHTTYGTWGDIPVPADYNGDGKDDIAIFRRATGTWWIRGQGYVIYGNGSDVPAAPQGQEVPDLPWIDADNPNE